VCRSKRIRRCTCQIKLGYSSGTTREPCAARCNVGRVTPKAVLAAARSSNLVTAAAESLGCQLATRPQARVTYSITFYTRRRDGCIRNRPSSKVKGMMNVRSSDGQPLTALL